MKLKVGDRVRINAVPGSGIPGYTIHKDTIKVYEKLIARNRSVRICEIDEDGLPWYCCRFKRKNGQWEWHSLVIMDDDTNWVKVRKRKSDYIHS